MPARARLLGTVLALTTAAALTACGTTEPSASAPSPDESASDKAGPVTVTDARGKKVTLPAPAERVAGTEWNVIEYAASLGVQPVGVSDIKGFETWDSAVELDPSATDIGTRGEPSIDTVASLDLDVLFVTDELVGDALEQIEKTTPVVVVPGGDVSDPVGAMWDNVDLVAKVTGTEDRAAELREEYDAKLAETKEAVQASDIGSRPVAFSDAYEANGAVSIRPYGEGSLLGGVLASLGLANAWSEVEGLEFDQVYGLAQTDVEGLTKLPDDTVYWYIGNDEDMTDAYRGTLKDNPVWNSLPFVERGDVHRIPDSIWMFGGPESMMQFLDAVQEAVA